jgi:protein gp37
MAELKIHPIATRFPLFGDDELSDLADHIKQHGLQQPIMLTADGSTIVDGINRHRACKRAGVVPTFRKLPRRYTEYDIIMFIIGANMRRRDLNPGQRAMLMLELAPTLEAEAKQRQHKGTGTDGSGGRGRKKTSPSKEDNRSGRVEHQLAALGKVGHATISRAKKVKTNSPSLAAKVTAGDMSLNDAHKQVRRKEKAEPEQHPKVQATKTHVVLVTHDGQQVPYKLPKGKPKFNRTNEHVSWAGWTWNPVTGCLHGCKYCYSREMAEVNENYKQVYPVGFTPLFHHERLDAPSNMLIPLGTPADSPDKRVFVCSMADLFGKWVPDKWIETVLASCNKNLSWEYLFLTKFPRRYVGLELPPTAWIGTSIDEQKRVRLADEAFRQIKDVRVKWLSLEPLLEPLEFTEEFLALFDWVVIGAQTQTEQPDGNGGSVVVPAFAPPFEWVARITAQAHAVGCAVYQKPNLLGSIDSQHPGMKLIQQVPFLINGKDHQPQGELALAAS